MRNLEINMRVVSATPSKWVTKPDSYGAIYKTHRWPRSWQNKRLWQRTRSRCS